MIKASFKPPQIQPKPNGHPPRPPNPSPSHPPSSIQWHHQEVGHLLLLTVQHFTQADLDPIRSERCRPTQLTMPHPCCRTRRTWRCDAASSMRRSLGCHSPCARCNSPFHCLKIALGHSPKRSPRRVRSPHPPIRRSSWSSLEGSPIHTPFFSYGWLDMTRGFFGWNSWFFDPKHVGQRGPLGPFWSLTRPGHGLA